MTKDEVAATAALTLALEVLEDWGSPLALPSIIAIKEALAQPDYRAVKTYHEGKPVYVSQPAQGLNTISTEELIYMTGVHDGKVLEREACAKVCEQPIDEIQITDTISEVVYMDVHECAEAIRARGNNVSSA